MPPKPKARKAGRDAGRVTAKAQEATAATPDQLAAIRKLAQEMRDIELRNADLKEEIKRNNERFEEIKWKDLLTAMDNAGMRSLVLEKEGNLPAYEVKTDAYYHANISADWPDEQRAAAFAWINKHEPGMLRNTYTVEFGKNSIKQQKALEAALKKLKLPYGNQYGVPWNTLTSYVKEQIVVHKKTPPLELLGAKVGRVATLKKIKEKL